METEKIQIPGETIPALHIPMQRAARRPEAINSLHNLWIRDQRGSHMGLQSRIDHQRSTAAPMLIVDEIIHSADVRQIGRAHV